MRASTEPGSVQATAFIAPWARRRERARERWEADAVALQNLLTVELPDAVEALASAWRRWELMHDLIANTPPDLPRERLVRLLPEEREPLQAALGHWRALAGARLELLAMRFEIRRTKRIDLAVYPMTARIYRDVFIYLSSYWSEDSDTEEYKAKVAEDFKREEQERSRLLAPVLKVVQTELWPRPRRRSLKRLWRRVKGTWLRLREKVGKRQSPSQEDVGAS